MVFDVILMVLLQIAVQMDVIGRLLDILLIVHGKHVCIVTVLRLLVGRDHTDTLFVVLPRLVRNYCCFYCSLYL